MNRYEKYATSIGFVNPKQGKTSKLPSRQLVGMKFDDFNPVAVKKALGRPNAHKVNLFFYRLSKDSAVLVNTKRNILLLANSARAVALFVKTVNN